MKEEKPVTMIELLNAIGDLMDPRCRYCGRIQRNLRCVCPEFLEQEKKEKAKWRK